MTVSWVSWSAGSAPAWIEGNIPLWGLSGWMKLHSRKATAIFVVITTARLATGRVVILAVFPNRQKDTLIEFLRSIPERLQRTIHTVCCDMYEGFSEAVREELKHVRIVIDRFHVARAYRDGLDDLRKQELKRLQKELPAAGYKQLKGSLWALRKKPADLTADERRILRLLFRYAPKLKLAYALQQQLTTIFDQHISPAAAKTKIRAWIKRVANLKHLFQRIFLDLEGYRLFADRPPYVAESR